MLKQPKKSIDSESGDTLIEVLLAMTILAIVMVGTIAIMNRGISLAYASLERSQVRAQLNRQTELLYYFRDAYMKSKVADSTVTPVTSDAAALWEFIRSHNVPSVSLPEECNVTSNAYYFKPSSTPGIYEYTSYPVTSSVEKLPVPGEGMWIEVTRTTTNQVTYVDAYIKACWQSAAGEGDQIMSTSVRLYDVN